MKKYIFLDNWVLSKFTKNNFKHSLVAFLKNNDYTCVITSLILVELYNPGWGNSPKNERTVHAINFLSEIPCVIVDPFKLFRAEIEHYPLQLEELPYELDLREVSDKKRAITLLKFMRRDKSFLKQGKDIEDWSNNYKQIKNAWLNDAQNIINNACDDGILQQDNQGKFINLEKSKELFLFSLDLRHTQSTTEKDLILNKIVKEKSGGNWVDLLAIRITSLCFWYSYIEIDRANLPAYKPSDIGDYYHMGLIPYCSAFTIDKNMQRLLQRFKEQKMLKDCAIYSESDLRSNLKLF